MKYRITNINYGNKYIHKYSYTLEVLKRGRRINSIAIGYTYLSNVETRMVSYIIHNRILDDYEIHNKKLQI